MTHLRQRFGPVVLMGGGIALVGAAGYAFVALSGHTLSTSDAAAVASVYLIVNIIGPGLFFALEQETSRATSAHRALGGGLAPIAARAAVVALSMLAAVLVLLIAISPALTERALSGQRALFAAVLLSVVTSAAVYLVRGLLGGTRRFVGYSATLIGEGLARLLPCVAIAASGMADAAFYAFVFAAGSGIGALAGAWWLRRRVDRADRDGAAVPTGHPAVAAHASVAAMGRAAATLLGGTLLMQLVANLAPIVVTSRLVHDTATAAAFAAGFVLVRIPLLLLAPVQAVVLPALASAAAQGRFSVVRTKLWSTVALAAAVGVPSAVLMWLLGPWAVPLLFGAQVRLPGTVCGLLGLGTLALLIAQVLQPGLVALGKHQLVTASWVLGSIALIALLALPVDPVGAATAAQLIGSVLVAGTMAVAVWRPLRQPDVVSLDGAAARR